MSIAQDKLTLALLPLTAASLIDPVTEKKVQLVSIIFLSNPNSEDIAKFDVVPVLSSQLNFDLETALSIDVALSTAVGEKFVKYQNKSVYSTLLTFDENGSIVNYAGTFSYTIV